MAGPAPTVQRALELAGGRLAAALLDVILGGEPVGEVAECLLRRGIPFAFVTAFSDTSVLPRRHRSHPTYFKPLSSRQILSVVHRLLDDDLGTAAPTT